MQCCPFQEFVILGVAGDSLRAKQANNNRVKPCGTFSFLRINQKTLKAENKTMQIKKAEKTKTFKNTKNNKTNKNNENKT